MTASALQGIGACCWKQRNAWNTVLVTRGSLPSGHCPGCPAAVCFPRVSGVEAVSPTAMVAPGRGQTVPTVRMRRAGAQMQGATHSMTGPQSTQLCQSPGLVRGCPTSRLPSSPTCGGGKIGAGGVRAGDFTAGD